MTKQKVIKLKLTPAQEKKLTKANKKLLREHGKIVLEKEDFIVKIDFSECSIEDVKAHLLQCGIDPDEVKMDIEELETFLEQE